MFGLGVNRLGFTANQKLFSPASLFNNGEAGVWYDPSAASGSLDWRRNLLEYTESFDNTIGWAKGINTVITPNASTYNGSSASRVQMPASAGTYVMAPVQLIEGVKYTFSIYLKNNGSPDLSIGVGTTVSSGVGEGVNYTVTNEWVRYVYVYTAATSSEYWFGIDNRSNSTAVDVYAWGAQLEEASTASSYQPILSTFENAFKTAFPSHTLYQDYQGVTPVTAVGQPVGLMLDKSEGLAQGPELVTNGDFATDSDWTKGTGWSISGGQAVGANATSNLQQSVTVSNGSLYKVKFTISSYTSGSINRVQIGSVTGATLTASELGEYESLILVNTTGSPPLYVVGTNFVGTIDNISVKEIQGSHATQPTSTKRPIYARHPEGGIRNLLNYTEQLDNSAWTKISTGGAAVSVIPSSYVAPDGTYSATQVLGLDTANSRLDQTTVLPALANKTYTYSVWLRGSGVVKINMGTSSGVGGSTEVTVTLTSTWTRHSATTTYNSSPTGNVRIHGVITRVTGTAPEVHMWSPQAEEATEASNYQKRVTDIDVTESGVGEVYYLKFDGVDDGMSINNLTSPNTPLTALFGYSAVGSNPSGGKYLLDVQTGRIVFAGSTVTAGHIGYFDGQWSEFAADSDAIKVLTYDLVENNAKIRVDGTQEYSDTTYVELGLGGQIGLFQNYPFTGSFLAGNMYQTILRAAESTDEEIAKAETYVANKTGLKAQVDGIATLDLNFGNNTYTAKNSNGGVI